MSSDAAPRGRGRGRARLSSAARTPSATPGPVDGDRSTPAGDVVADAPASSSASTSRAVPAAGTAGRRLGTFDSTAASAGPSRGLGGLMGLSAGSELLSSRARTGTPAGDGGEQKPKIKFVPNMKRKSKAADPEPAPVVKKEEGSFRSGDRATGRGRGRGRGRGEIVMTASGPMAMGPSGNGAVEKARRSALAREAGGGGSGAGRSSGPASLTTTTRRFTAPNSPSSSDIDASDFGEDDASDTPAFVSEGAQRGAKDLWEIGQEDEMAPLTLPRDPEEVAAQRERRKERKERRRATNSAKVKAEEQDAKDEAVLRGDTSVSATPAPAPGTLADLPAVAAPGEEKKIEDLKGLALERSVADAFVDPSTGKPYSQEKLFVFQFPRQFPKLVDPSSTVADVKIKSEDVKPAISALGGGRGPDEPLPWGLTGTREELASRWPSEEGVMGEMFVHQSGKVSMRVNGDLIFEIIPGAQTTFLQEVAVINPGGAPPEDPEELPSVEDMAARQPSISIMGQTSQKFIVVPEMENLLKRIGEQEEEEEQAAIKARSRKKKEIIPGMPAPAGKVKKEKK